MSRSLNRVELIGHLGKDAETRFTPSGVPRVSFSLATSRSWKPKDSSEWKQETDWHNVVIWRAENLAQYLTKGKQVFVAGRLSTRNYEKNGVKHYMTEVVADPSEVILLGGGDRQGGGDQVPSSTAAPAARSSADDAGGLGITDDDVPF